MENRPENPMTRQMTVRRPMGRKRPPQMIYGAVFVALGCVASAFTAFAGTVLVAYGMREMLCAGGMRGFGISVIEGAVLCAAAMVIDPMLGILLVTELLASAGTVWCMRRAHATTLGICLVIAGCTLAYLGIEAAVAAASGSSLSAVVAGLFDSMAVMAREMLGTGIEADLSFGQIMPVLRVLWPLVYVATVATNVLAAGVGSYFMYMRTQDVPRLPSASRYDAPLWSVGVLGFSVLGLGASFMGFPGSDVLCSVCVTVLMCIRFVFTLQGFGVLFALMNRYRLGCLGRYAIVFLAIWLETVFFLLSIVGLIDVWANFRKLDRGSHDRAQS